jgi:hypothetical protein
MVVLYKQNHFDLKICDIWPSSPVSADENVRCLCWISKSQMSNGKMIISFNYVALRAQGLRKSKL